MRSVFRNLEKIKSFSWPAVAWSCHSSNKHTHTHTHSQQVFRAWNFLP